MSAEPKTGWKQRRVDELFEIFSGVTMGPARAPSKRTRGYLRVANVQRGRIDLTDVMQIETFHGDGQRYALAEGDLLIVEGHANPGEIGRCAVVDAASEGLLHQNHLFRLRSNRMLPQLAMELLNSPMARRYWLARTATSSGLYTINRRMLAALRLPDIPLREQQEIVEILDAVAESEQTAERAIAKLRTIRSSFIEERIAAIDRWAPLCERLETIEAGNSPNLPGIPASPGEWGVLKVSAIGKETFRATENKRVFDPGLIDEACEVAPGDLIISRASTSSLVGRTCVVTESPYRLLLSDKTLRIVLKSGEASRRYVNICFESVRLREQIEAVSSGISAGMQNISQKAIERIQIPWVDIDLQRKFVAEVHSIDDRVSVEQSVLAKLREVRLGLTASLLTGSRKSLV
ncbi:restriction endonuclease subunit S [Streptomyces mirabilis]|uniref:restriction endonuclease subunit S n=1 Tax=Streptomyces mirabilis TaxID=68239 RepID=UPI0033C2293B